MKEAPIISRPGTREFRDGYDRVFGKKRKKHTASSAVELCAVCGKTHEVKRVEVPGRFFGGGDGPVQIQSCPNLPRDTFVPMKDGRIMLDPFTKEK